MNELALFAGAGGGILGGKLLGWRTVCAVELEGYPRERLMQRQDDGILEAFPVWDDVQTFDGTPWSRCVDIITGGFPCQDISIAGKGKGIEGSRSGMWKEMARIICEVEPPFIFVENSPALTFRGLGTVLGDLAKMGYNARWGVLGGHDVGASTDGKRIWIFATKANCPMLESVDLPQPLITGPEGSRGRQFAGAIRAMLQPDDYARIKRDPDAVAEGMDRLKAIGNGQIPAVAALAWRILSNCKS